MVVAIDERAHVVLKYRCRISLAPIVRFVLKTQRTLFTRSLHEIILP